MQLDESSPANKSQMMPRVGVTVNTRTAKIAALKEQVTRGVYSVSGAEIARKMLSKGRHAPNLAFSRRGSLGDGFMDEC